jgi:hypothetical protein
MSAQPVGEVEIRDCPDDGRYELLVDGELAGFAQYRDRAGRRIFVHTEVDRRFAGRGLGTRLASGVLDDVRARGMRFIPRCPFIRGFVERHPEYLAPATES